MSGATFDTLQFAETLQEAGIPEIQARAISKAVRNAHETAELVTRTDLREAVSELRSEIQAGRVEMQSEILRLDSRLERFDSKLERFNSKLERLDSKLERLGLQLTIRLGGLVVVALGAFVTLSKWIA